MKKEDYITAIDSQAERRFFAPEVEVRAGSGGKGSTIRGIASIVGKRYNMGWYEEEILPGAFEDRLQDDVAALFNHDPNLILARTSSKTLSLALTAEGSLQYEYVTPNRSYAKDLEDAINTGDVRQSSFAFRINEDRWTWYDDKNKLPLRQIVSFKRLYDVSPVTYPASPDTTVAKRSMETQQCRDRTPAGSSPETRNQKPDIDTMRMSLELLGIRTT